MSDKGKSAHLTASEFLIMSLLVESRSKEMYGLGLVAQSEGKLKKGTVYVLLGRLEEKGFVRGRTVIGESAIPRKLYQPTGLGQRVFAAWKHVADMGGLRGALA